MSEKIERHSMPVVLTIAGSDSGGGAGIQADLKTFAAHGVYGTSALTAVTAQNTHGVQGVEVLSPALITSQIASVAADFTVMAVKTGMLASTPIIESVAEALQRYQLGPVVVDPVMVATSGDRLLAEEAIDVLCRRLLPLALVVTPNLVEAEVLADQRITSPETMAAAAARIGELGARYVLIKGGHVDGPPTDLLYDVAQSRAIYFAGERIATRHTHGTGCTLSAAITAQLARGIELAEAVVRAKRYVTGAILNAPGLGGGHGPLQHFWSIQRQL